MLGIWKDDKGIVHLDVSVKIPLKAQQGLIDEQLAKAMYIGTLSKQQSIAITRKAQLGSDAANKINLGEFVSDTTYLNVYKKNGQINHKAINYLNNMVNSFYKTLKIQQTYTRDRHSNQ